MTQNSFSCVKFLYVYVSCSQTHNIIYDFFIDSIQVLTFNNQNRRFNIWRVSYAIAEYIEKTKKLILVFPITMYCVLS